MAFLKPEIAIERIKDRELSPFEKASFLEKVQENYIKMADAEKRFIKLDATESKEKLKEKCLKIIEKEMG